MDKRIYIAAGATYGFMVIGSALRKVTLATGASTTLTVDKTYTALCYGGDSVLYGADKDGIYSIHQTTGVATLIAALKGGIDNIVYKDTDELWITQGNSLMLLDIDVDTATGTAVLTTETVTSVTITNDGFYTRGVPTVAFSGGGGTGAAAYAALVGSKVYNIVITAAGSGYTSVPTVTISAGTAGEVTFLKQDI